MTHSSKPSTPCEGCGYSCFKKNCGVRMPLNVQTKQRNGKHVAPGFCDLYRREIDMGLNESNFSEVLYLLCTAWDEAAASEDTCIIFGTTRDRTSYSVTVKYRGQSATAYGASISEVLESLKSLLTD